MATTTGVPPTALQPAAEPPTRCAAEAEATGGEAAGAGSGALATLVAGASGAEATRAEGAAPAGVAWAVCDPKGLENGLPLELNRATSWEQPASQIMARPVNARRGTERPSKNATRSLMFLDP